MISYAVYRFLHLIGVFLVLTALGGLALHATNGGTPASNTARGIIAAAHGLGVLLILVAGFGMLARLGVAHGAAFPGWIWAKFGVWLVIAAWMALPYRFPRLARPSLLIVPLLGAISAYLAIFKPF
jgi:hypothetical protein